MAVVKLKVGESIQGVKKLTILAFGQHREGLAPPVMVVTAEVETMEAVVASTEAQVAAPAAENQEVVDAD